MVCGLLHGFYPWYIIAFFNFAIITILSKSFYKISLKFPNFYYDSPIFKSLKFIVNRTILNYFGAFFCLLNLKECW